MQISQRFILQESETPEHFVLTDTELMIVCKFQRNKFNETQQFTMLENVAFEVVAKAMREAGDWLVKYHSNII